MANTEGLARHRTGQAAAIADRVEAVISDYERRPDPDGVSLAAVARAAHVSRSWLYRSEYRTRVEALRITSTRPGASSRSTQSRRTEASLSSRLETALIDNRRLRDENAALRRQLELELGQRRQSIDGG